MDFQYDCQAGVPATNKTFDDPALIPFWRLLLHNITADGGQEGCAAYQDRPPAALVWVKRRGLIVVQNLPVPFDRRVWLGCQALISAGYRPAVAWPKGSRDRSYQIIDTIQLHRYRPYAPDLSKVSFATKYAYSFLATAGLALKARRSGRFAVIQASNPPNVFWPIALAFRAIQGRKILFDHHGLCPEPYESRFPDGLRLQYRALGALARTINRTTDQVISANDFYRQISVKRSGKASDEGRVRIKHELARCHQDPAHLALCERLTGGAEVLESAGEA